MLLLYQLTVILLIYKNIGIPTYIPIYIYYLINPNAKDYTSVDQKTKVFDAIYRIIGTVNGAAIPARDLAPPPSTP